MADTLRTELLYRDFNRMLEELSEIDARVEFRDVVLAVATRVVQKAMDRTRAAQAGSIRKNFEEKEYTTFHGKRYKLSNRYPDELWAQIEQFRKERLSVKLASRGLSKRSWLELASTIGASLTAPAYVSTSNYKGKTYPQDGASTETGSGPNFALEIINSSPIVQSAGGYGALLSAMRSEISYFEHNMRNGAFRTLESRVKKYPGIFLAQTAA